MMWNSISSPNDELELYRYISEFFEQMTPVLGCTLWRFYRVNYDTSGTWLLIYYDVFDNTDSMFGKSTSKSLKILREQIFRMVDEMNGEYDS